MSSEHTRLKAATGLAEAIETMAARLLQDSSQLLAEVAEGAVAAVPGAIGAVVAELLPGSQLHAAACYGRVPEGFIRLQNELAQGPSVDAATGLSHVRVADASADERWPAFTAQASGMEIRGALCVPLALGTKVVGALSLLSDDIDPFDEESEDIAVIFAAHAAVVVAGSHREAHLALARDSRDLIGQAKGILMERFHVTDPVAFALLVRISKEVNQKLAVVARHLCATGELMGTGHPAPKLRSR